jgi:hypothetical protein
MATVDQYQADFSELGRVAFEKRGIDAFSSMLTPRLAVATQ